MRSLARLSRSLGFDCVFGAPPPASPTFEVAPGGVAICAKIPLTLRKLHPPELAHWEIQGRVLVVELISELWSMIVIGIYGFPASHEQHSSNDDLVAACLSWGGGRKSRVLIMGDLNESVQTCLPIAASRELHMTRVSPDLPSTWSKAGEPSKTLPIDHCFANQAVRQDIVEVSFRRDLLLSDHIPLVCSLALPSSPSPAWLWPKPAVSPLPARVSSPPFPMGSGTFAEWSEKARRWLQHAYAITIPSKVCRATVTPTYPPPPMSQQCKDIWKAWRALLHVEKLRTPHAYQIRSLTLRLNKVGLKWDGSVDALPTTKALLQDGLNMVLADAHTGMMKVWKEKVRQWTISGTAVHRYVKNDEPPKLLALRVNERSTNDPLEMSLALGGVWWTIEAWPEGVSEEATWNAIEDAYSLFLPHVQCGVWLTPEMMMDQAKYMKESSRGADGWAVHEIKALPLDAWKEFLRLYDEVWVTSPPPLLLLKRRTPIQKTVSGVPNPEDIRPIDVFSTLLRVHSSRLCLMLKPWLKEVTHKSQTSTHGGILNALAALAAWTEATQLDGVSVYAFSIDLTKMFNMLSPTISGSWHMWQDSRKTWSEGFSSR